MNDSPLLIDTNSFIYFLTKEKGRWQKVEQVYKSKRLLFTHLFVLNELRMKLPWIAASHTLETTKKYKIINYIKKNHSFRREVLKKYITFFNTIQTRVEILPPTVEEELVACSFSAKYGLLPTDASIIASMQTHKIPTILTADKDFLNIPGIEVEMV